MNNNCLAGYRCPRCGSEGPFNIETEDFIEWKDDGAAYCYEPEFKPGGTWAWCETVDKRQNSEGGRK